VEHLADILWESAQCSPRASQYQRGLVPLQQEGTRIKAALLNSQGAAARLTTEQQLQLEVGEGAEEAESAGKSYKSFLWVGRGLYSVQGLLRKSGTDLG
jgi:hypothetical protein